MTRIILTSFLVFLTTNTLFCQENEKDDYGISLRAGYAYSLKNPQGEQQKGFHFGLNMHEKQDIHLVWEGQANVNYVSDVNNSWNINVLTGSRLYFNKSDNKNRYYLTSMLGLSLNYASAENPDNSEVELGSSVGFFAQFQKMAIGISLEDPSILVFKLGYDLQ